MRSAGAETFAWSVPDILVAAYLVATPRAPTDIDARTTAEQLPEPLQSMTFGMLATGDLTVRARPLDDLRDVEVRRLEIFGATTAQLDAVATAEGLLVVRASTGPGWPPAHEWAARSIATGLAEELDATIIDLFVPAVLDRYPARRSLPDEHGQIALIDWLLVLRSTGDRGVWLTTRGLARFGLPELQTVDVPPTLTPLWTQVLHGVASQLLTTWTDALRVDRPPFLELEALLTISTRDIARAYGGDPVGEGTARIRLRLDPAEHPDEQTFLTLVPPDDFGFSAGEYVARVCAALFGDLPNEIRRTPSSAEMDAAIATARASMHDARARFIAGTLPPEAHLTVKYLLQVDGRKEYLWFAVTSWADPDWLIGHSTVDAELDATIRVGRPVRVASASVSDWGLWTDDEGIIEGGWTDQLLSD